MIQREWRREAMITGFRGSGIKDTGEWGHLEGRVLSELVFRCLRSLVTENFEERASSIVPVMIWFQKP